jgi:predicted nucleic-acid-binding protein
MIRALDTNIVVRFLADEQSPQHRAASVLLANRFALSMSVVLESEWVLRSVYHWRRDQIADALDGVLDLPGLAAAPPELAWIIDRYRGGADFADMVHLCATEGADVFATFDRDLIKVVGDAAPIAIEVIA